MNTTNTAQEPPRLITRQQAGTRYCFSIRKIDDLISAGVLPAIKLSKKCVRIPVAQADEAFDRLTVGGAKWAAGDRAEANSPAQDAPCPGDHCHHGHQSDHWQMV